MGYIQWRVKAQ